eukprot:6490073-Amphidinium_carterae.2
MADRLAPGDLAAITIGPRSRMVWKLLVPILHERAVLNYNCAQHCQACRNTRQRSRVSPENQL